MSSHKQGVETADGTESAKKKKKKEAVVERNIPDCTFKSFCYETASSGWNLLSFRGLIISAIIGQYWHPAMHATNK